MLDEVRPNNNHVAMDATLGLAKGIGMRTVLSKVAGGQQAPAMMALQFGTASRFVDSALTRQNYVDAGDNLTLSSFGNGLLKVGATTFNPVALGSDVATAGFAHGLTKMAPTFFAGNTFRSMTTMTFANGWANGMAQEGHAQFQKGQFDAAAGCISTGFCVWQLPCLQHPAINVVMSIIMVWKMLPPFATVNSSLWPSMHLM